MKKHYVLLLPLLLMAAVYGCKKEKRETPAPSITVSGITATDSSVTFSIAVKDAAGYSYGIKETGEMTDISSSEGGTYTIKGLQEQTTYTLTAFSYNESGTKSREAAEKFTTAKKADNPGEDNPGEDNPDEDDEFTVPHGEKPFIRIGDRKIEMKSVVYAETDGLCWFYVSTAEGVNNYIDLIYGNGGKNDYISISLDPSLLGKETDMKTEEKTYLLMNAMYYNTVVAQDVSVVTNSAHSSISDGRFLINRNGNDIEGYIRMTIAATGETFEIYGTTTATETPSNYLSVNGEKNQIGSGFIRTATGGGTELFLSPETVLMGELIYEVRSYYMRFSFDDNAVTGMEPVNLSDIKGNFEIEYNDRASGKRISISNTDLKGATGTIAFYKYGLPGYVLVRYDLEIDGTKLEAYAEGQFDQYARYDRNIYKYEGKEYPILSSFTEKGNDGYMTFYLSGTEGLTDLESIKKAEDLIVVKAHINALTGQIVYFRDEAKAGHEMSISYKGKLSDNSDNANGLNYVCGAAEGNRIAIEFLDNTTGLEGYFGGISIFND